MNEFDATLAEMREVNGKLRAHFEAQEADPSKFNGPYVSRLIEHFNNLRKLAELLSEQRATL